MNTHDHDDNTLDANLRLQLRGLRPDIAPAADLWPGIAARLSAAPANAAPRAPRRTPRNIAPWALAASLVLSLGIAWRMQPPPAAPAGAQVRLIDREADAMTREYHAALQELHASAPQPSGAATPAQPALRELDQSARLIRDAIDRDPGATYLLGRLQRTYTLRLELTQRSVDQAAGLS